MDLKSKLDQFRLRADPETDRFVDSLADQLGSDDELGRLTQHIFAWNPGEVPPAGAPAGPALWRQIGDHLCKPFQLEGWDLKRIKRAQETYREFSNVARAVLGISSLPALYIHPEIALTLMGSGRLLEHTLMRLNETQRFVDQVTKPGSLGPQGSPDGGNPSAWVWVRKVRLMHAIRRHLARLHGLIVLDPLETLRHHVPGWTLRDDEPVDQVEIAYVMLTFSWVVVDGLDKLGVRMNEEQGRNHVYLWALVTHMLGVDDELLPKQPGQELEFARALFEHVRNGCLAAAGDDRIDREKDVWLETRSDKVQQAGRDAGRQLMAALLVVALDTQLATFPEQWKLLLRWRWIDDALRDLPRVLVRMLAGVPTARMLYVGRAPFLHWVVCRIGLRLVNLRSWSTRTECPLRVPRPSRPDRATAWRPAKVLPEVPSPDPQA